MLLLFITFSSAVKGQITKDPDVDSICAGSSVTVTYTDPWTTGFWLAIGGTSSDATSPTNTITYATDGSYTIVSVVFTGGFFPTISSTSIVVVAQPAAPTLNFPTSSEIACEDELVYATFIAGTGGLGCNDEFQYSTRTGVTWSGPSTYTEGQLLSTGGVDEIIIEGRRTNCNTALGCSGTAWLQLVQWISAVDITPPTFTAPADITIYRDASCVYDEDVAFTGDVTDEADNCSVGLNATFVDAVNSTDPCNIIITRTWSLEDDEGNSAADQVQTITVEDNTPPTFSIPADITIYSDASCAYDASVTATGDVTDEADNCSAGLNATFVDAVDVSDPTNIIITRTWSLVDDCGNAAPDQEQIITVNDNILPVITACPTDINTLADTSYCGAEVTWIEPTASDNCPGVVLTSTQNPGDFFPIGTTTVTYTATDASGLTIDCFFDVTVGAASLPSITGVTTVCTPVQETYSVTDPGTHTYLWTVTSGTISGSATNPSVTVDWSGTAQGTLEVTISSGSGCINSNNITVDKYATPSIGNINSNNSLIRR